MKYLVGSILGLLVFPHLASAETLDFSGTPPESGTRVGTTAPSTAAPAPERPTNSPPSPAAGVNRTVTHRPLTKEPEVHEPAIPDGFYLRVVTGTALVWMRGVNPTGQASRMLAGAGESTIAIGGAVANGWVVAGTLHAIEGVGELSNGPFEDTEVTFDGRSIKLSERAYAGSSLLGAMVDWYPNPRGGWHVGVAAGLGATNLMFSADDTKLFATGLGGLVTGGYDWRLGRDFWLGLSLQVSGVTRGTMKDEDGRDTGWKMKSFGLGVGSSLVYF